MSCWKTSGLTTVRICGKDVPSAHYQSLGYSKRTILATMRAFCNARRLSASLTALSSRRARMVFLSSLLTALARVSSCLQLLPLWEQAYF